jgi:Trk-type K+ transport system membrane component
MFAMHFLTIIGSLGLMVYFIFNIFKNERLEQNYKIMWTILLFFAGMLVMPVYWFLYIWRDAPAAATPANAGPVYLNQAGTENWTNRAATYEQRPDDEYARQPPNWRE